MNVGRSRSVTLLLAVVLAIGLGGGAVAAGEHFLRTQLETNDSTVLLLLGADMGPPRGGSPLSARADGFHLLVVSPDGTRATFLNFPRDSYVAVPGQGRTKINACLVSGPENCVATIQQNWGVEVDAYLLTSMNGLKEGVEQFGRVRVNVEHTVYDGGQDIEQTGEQTLSGSQALTYGRDRKNRPGGDFARSEAQATILQAAHRQLIDEQPSVRRIAEVVGIVQRTTVTNASPQQLLRLGYLGATISPENINNVNVPGNVGTAGAASVVYLPERANALIRDVAADGVVGQSGS